MDKYLTRDQGIWKSLINTSKPSQKRKLYFEKWVKIN